MINLGLAFLSITCEFFDPSNMKWKVVQFRNIRFVFFRIITSILSIFIKFFYHGYLNNFKGDKSAMSFEIRRNFRNPGDNLLIIKMIKQRRIIID